MMLDYWTCENHIGCAKCASPLHKVFEAYVAPSSDSELPDALELALIRMFEIRINLEFAMRDIIRHSIDATDLSHFLAKTALQDMVSEVYRFAKLYEHIHGLIGEKESILHLVPISARAIKLAKGIPDLENPDLRNFTDLRDSVMHPGSGMFGAAKMLDNKNSDERVPDNSLLVCVSLVNTFIDGLMHRMPETFYSALSKTSSSIAPIITYNSKSFAKRIELYNKKNAIHCLDFASMGDGMIPLASELVRLRGAFQISIAIYSLIERLQDPSRPVSKMSGAFLYRQILYYIRRLVVDLYILVDVYEKLCKESPSSLDNDNVMRELLACKPKIGHLRTAMEYPPTDRHVEFSAALEDGIGAQRLLFLASTVAEWVRKNANHYQDTCDHKAHTPDLATMDRRLDFRYVMREVAPYREEAHRVLKEHDSDGQ